jgi:hypothetical protein
VIELGGGESELARLLREAGASHLRARARARGEDPDWPAWYADWLAPRLGALPTEVHLDPRRLAVDLQAADEDHRRRDPGMAWPEFCAEWLMDRYGPPVS